MSKYVCTSTCCASITETRKGVGEKQNQTKQIETNLRRYARVAWMCVLREGGGRGRGDDFEALAIVPYIYMRPPTTDDGMWITPVCGAMCV